MKKLMLILMAAQAMTLAVPMAAQADVLKLQPTVAPRVTAEPAAAVVLQPEINAPFSRR